MRSAASTVPAGTAAVGGKGLRAGVLGLTGSVVIAASSVAPAYSLAAALAGMVAAVGAKTPALFVIGFIPMMLTAFAFRELADQTPDCGTTFTWSTRAFGPWVGWLAGWAAAIAAIVAVGNGAQIAAIYLLEALHLNAAAHSMVAQIAVGGLAVVVLLVLCIRGIDVTARTQTVLLVMQFGMLVLVSVVALGKVFSHHAGPQAVTPEWSWLVPSGLSASAIAHGAILCVFVYWGWDACLSVSEETKDPHRNPGKAAVLTTVLVLGTYVLVSFAIQAFAGFGRTGIGLNNPQNASDTLSVLGDQLVVAGIGADVLGADRAQHARDGVLPGPAATSGSCARAIPNAMGSHGGDWRRRIRHLPGDDADQPELAGGHGVLAWLGDRVLLRGHRVRVYVDLSAHAAGLGAQLLASRGISPPWRSRDDVGVRPERSRHVCARLRQDPLRSGRRRIHPRHWTSRARNSGRSVQRRCRRPRLLPWPDP
jgi:Amino acid permease